MNGIRCRISSSIRWCCQNEAHLPKTEKKYEKNEIFHEFQVNANYSRIENSQISARRKHLNDPQWTPFNAEFRARFGGAVKMKSSCQKQKKNTKKTNIRRISSDLKSHSHENCEISDRRRPLKDLQRTPLDAEFRAIFGGALRMKPSCQKQKKNTKKKKYSTNFKWSEVTLARELGNFWKKETPERSPTNAIRCRISSSIRRRSQNEVQLPKTEKKYEKNEIFHEFQVNGHYSRIENSQISARRTHLTDLQWTAFDAQFRALFAGAVRMKSSCQK